MLFRSWSNRERLLHAARSVAKDIDANFTGPSESLRLLLRNKDNSDATNLIRQLRVYAKKKGVAIGLYYYRCPKCNRKKKFPLELDRLYTCKNCSTELNSVRLERCGEEKEETEEKEEEKPSFFGK